MILVDTSELQQSFRVQIAAIHEAAKSSVRRAAVIAWQTAHETSLYKDRTGKLRDSTRVEDGKDDYSANVVARRRYASYIENGTPPHEIRPKRARALRFVMNGSVVFARSVQHPGTKPRPFMRIAEKSGEQALESILQQETDRALA